MLQLTGQRQVVASGQHDVTRVEARLVSARQVYWPGQKLMMMMHTASTRHAFALFIISCHVATGWGNMSGECQKINDQSWRSLMTLLAATGTHEQLHLFADTFQAPKMQPHPVPGKSCLRLCLLGKHTHTHAHTDLVGCSAHV